MKITICAHSKRGWNGEIKDKRSQLGREKRRGRRSAATPQAKAELQKSVRRAEDKMWNYDLKNQRGAEVWGAANFANALAEMTVAALTNRDGKEENMNAEKEEMLRGESFPLNESNQYFELPPGGQAHQSVTEEAVERALLSRTVKKTPGLENLSLEPYAYSRSGTKRALWSWRRQPSGQANTQQSGSGSVWS